MATKSTFGSMLKSGGSVSKKPMEESDLPQAPSVKMGKNPGASRKPLSKKSAYAGMLKKC